MGLVVGEIPDSPSSLPLPLPVLDDRGSDPSAIIMVCCSSESSGIGSEPKNAQLGEGVLELLYML